MQHALGTVFGWFVIPAIAALLLVAVLPQLGVTIRVALSDGESGTFTAVQRSCVSHGRNGQQCQWRGRFVADTGMSREPVYLEGDPRGWQPGTTVRATWLPDQPSTVYRHADPRPLLLVVGLSLVAAAALLAWAVAALYRLTGRRTPSWVAGVHAACGWPPLSPRPDHAG